MISFRSATVVHCFVKDISQESLDALVDWASGINVRGYAISPDFENCFVLKILPADLKRFLFKSGNKGFYLKFCLILLDYLGNEIFLRYTHKSMEKELKFEKIWKKIEPLKVEEVTEDNLGSEPQQIVDTKFEPADQFII